MSSQVSPSKGWLSALGGHLRAVDEPHSSPEDWGILAVVTLTFENLMKTVALKPYTFTLFAED